MSQEENFSLASSWPVFLSFLLPHFRLAHCLLWHEAEVTDLKLKSPGKMDKKDTQKTQKKQIINRIKVVDDAAVADDVHIDVIVLKESLKRSEFQ